MRRISLYLFLAVCYTANAFAANSSISRTIPTKNSDENIVVEHKTDNVNRATVSRNVSRTAPKKVDVVSRNNTSTKQSQNVVSRSVNARTKTSKATLEDGVNTVGRNARTEAASINSSAAVRRAGITLRASTAEVGGRATIGNTDIQTGSNIDEQVRTVQGRAGLFGKQKTVTAESLTAAKDLMEKTNELNTVCQTQYNECMDQFCAVVDANQKRCSCSSNLAKYAKAQKAAEDANVELNEVAQRIRYVGLSADEISAIMSATEAELAMEKNKDNTETRSMLEDIADMIKDPTASTTLTASSDSLLDLDLDFSSDSADVFSLDMFSNSSNDISSKRGSALYKEAVKRCKTVIKQCKDAGGTESQITGNYDLAIAKDCIAYEQGLEKLNETLKGNVRSANLMLQKARLAVLQNKNEYDAKGCIQALDNCMLDEMVCGENYLKCLDPTKRYIDENGNVVLGQNIANITKFMQQYNNTKITAESIQGWQGDTTCPNEDGGCIVNYLMKKIGTGATVKDGGLCRAVLDKCQYYTYDNSTKTPTYKPYNEVVVNYIQRAMVNIRASQSKIISDYASTCMSDVQDCYNQQNSQINSWTDSASVDNIYKVLMGTCYNVALTCGYAVFAYDKEMGQKVDALSDEKDKKATLIKGISSMFYQSMLCPDNSFFVDDDTNTTNLAMVNDKCACKDGYVVNNGTCVANCPSGTFISNGVCKSDSACTYPFVKKDNSCVCDSGYVLSDGKCYKNTCSQAQLNTYHAIAGKTTSGGKCEATRCVSGRYLFNDACLTSCPSGYEPKQDSSQTCIFKPDARNNNPDECGYHQLDDSEVSDQSDRLGDPGLWDCTIWPNAYIQGVAMCSTTPGTYAKSGNPVKYDYDDVVQGAKYCWCMAHYWDQDLDTIEGDNIIPYNDHVDMNVDSDWVFSGTASSVANCRSTCAESCMEDFSSVEFRKTIYDSIAE